MLESLLGFKRLKAVYNECKRRLPEQSAWATACEELKLKIQFFEDEHLRIPKEGPLIIVSNHPFGALDGIILSHLIEKRRKDFKMLVNNVLTERIPELKPNFLDLELYQKGTKRINSNALAVKAAIDYVENQKAVLVVFPAGTPSLAKVPWGTAIDMPWKSGVARIIKGCSCDILPVFFKGQNSRIYQTLGLTGRRFKVLRTLILGRELVRKIGSTTLVRFGSPIPGETLKGLSIPEVLKHLRERVYLLADERTKTLSKLKTLNPFKFTPGQKKIIKPISDNVIQKIISDYSKETPSSLIIDKKNFSVHLFDGSRAPQEFFKELGRLREITFRSVGEGTGKSYDTDEFDNFYEHLFVWNKTKKQISGAYRIGNSESIFKDHGPEGFYTQSFFPIKKEFYEMIRPAVEVGRTFIVADDQKQWTLFYLWKGIGQYMAAMKNNRKLFGTVSVSKEYSEKSRHLISQYFMRKHALDDNLRNYFTGETRLYQPKSLSDSALEALLESTHSISDLDKLIKDFEPDRKGLPTLYKRYGELGAKYLGFNIDYDFGQSLDGFILVDLTKSPEKKLSKFFSDTKSVPK